MNIQKFNKNIFSFHKLHSLFTTLKTLLKRFPYSLCLKRAKFSSQLLTRFRFIGLRHSLRAKNVPQIHFHAGNSFPFSLRIILLGERAQVPSSTKRTGKLLRPTPIVGIPFLMLPSCMIHGGQY